MQEALCLVFDTLKIEFRGTDHYHGPLFVGHRPLRNALLEMPMGVAMYGFIYPPRKNAEVVLSFSIRREDADQFVMKFSNFAGNPVQWVASHKTVEILCKAASIMNEKQKDVTY